MEEFSIEWLNKKLECAPRGTKKALAERLGQPNVVTKILTEGRRVSVEEAVTILRFFAEIEGRSQEQFDLEMQVRRELGELSTEELRFLLTSAQGLNAKRHEDTH